MKKSQVLAALALAFALGLGVVAPVANTYAAIVGDGTTVSDDQMKTLNSDVKATLRSYNELEKANEYVSLYTNLEALSATLKQNAKTLLDKYNDDATLINIESVNTNIDIVNDTTYEGADGLYEKNPAGSATPYKYILAGHTLAQATLRNMPELKEATTIESAYSQVKALYDAAVANQEILTKNYVESTNETTVLNTVLGSTNYVAQQTAAWLDSIEATITTGLGANTPAAYAEAYIKPISEDAYKALVNGQAWKDAENAFGKSGVRFALLLNTAKALPKYNYVKPLVEAKENFDKITATNQAVDYDKALEYVKAFNAAIANYKNGVVTPDGTNKPGDGTGEGNNNPSVSPDTGAIINSESSATSVAMVAGLATALTAAGAGVVAYRNARRSTRK